MRQTKHEFCCLDVLGYDSHTFCGAENNLDIVKSDATYLFTLK